MIYCVCLCVTILSNMYVCASVWIYSSINSTPSPVVITITITSNSKTVTGV